MTRHPSAGATVALALAATGAAGILVRRERRAAASLERLGGAALESLLAAIDANDPVTGAHVRRVARYALVLADALRLENHERHSVELVALFHDVGKIHEALFDVIHDDSALTPAERRAIRTHPVRGARVLAPLAAFYPDLAHGVLAHHERWDGTGYPRHLARAAIPLSARIVAIADAFDAITHARRYSTEHSPTAGAQTIAAERGTHFDPDLVDLFLLPPVFAQVRAEMHAAHQIEHRAGGTRRGRAMDAPDVSFRWRDTAPALTARDRLLR